MNASDVRESIVDRDLVAGGEAEGRYQALLQEAAKDLSSVFFPWAGEGHEKMVGDLSCEDMSGWLVPEAEAPGFYGLWASRSAYNSDVLSDCWRWAVWEELDGAVSVRFEEW